MKRHLRYAQYLLRHKWYVAVAGFAIGVPFWRILLHDWHKLLPGEWLAYARCFYRPDGGKQYVQSNAFAYAWLDHQRRASHHWQRWLLCWDSGTVDPLPMPRAAVLEMVADWYGAGRAITGLWNARGWYADNRHHIHLHRLTRVEVERLLDLWQPRFSLRNPSPQLSKPTTKQKG